MATMCGPEHHVSHSAQEGDADLVSVKGVGLVKAVVLLRCNVMRFARGVCAPNPKRLFNMVTPVLNSWMLDHPLQLPTLQECQAAQA